MDSDTVTKRPSSATVVGPKRIRTRVPLGEAIDTAVKLAATIVQLTPKTHLFAFVPLCYVLSSPSICVKPVVDNNNNDDDEDEDDESETSDDSDSISYDDDDAHADNSNHVTVCVINEETSSDSDTVDSDDNGETSSDGSDDNDYADDWDGDTDGSDDDGDDDDDISGDNENNGNVDVNTAEFQAIGNDLYVANTYVPTFYTSFDTAFNSLFALRRSRTPLEGIIVEFEPRLGPPSLRVTEHILASAPNDDDDDDDNLLFCDTNAANKTVVGGVPNGNGGATDDDDDDEEEEILDTNVGDEKKYDEQLQSEDRICAPDIMDEIMAGPPPREPFPCQLAMAFHIRRYAEGNPSVPECDFAAMYDDCENASKDGRMGWVDIDANGTSCVRAHWRGVVNAMVICGEQLVDTNKVLTHLNKQITDISGNPIVTDAEKFALLRKLNRCV